VEKVGPAVVMIHKTRDRKWTMAALANHVWSVAGDDDREDVSQTSLQPILTPSFPDSWSMTFSSESSYNWHAGWGNAWTVPLNVSASTVVKFGRRPVSFGLGGFPLDAMCSDASDDLTEATYWVPTIAAMV